MFDWPFPLPPMILMPIADYFAAEIHIPLTPSPPISPRHAADADFHAAAFRYAASAD